ncbi:MAG: class I SAM-dependent methyltransferase [Acidobacteriia bacterium]|nr:class I SAM-dependent methyltransferase [Terriglobia bacterium]
MGILVKTYWWLEKRITPALRYSQYHYYDLLKAFVPEGCSWLDLGCGHQMFAGWMTGEERELASRASRLVGIDLDLEGMRRNAAVTGRVLGSLEHLPFPAGSFDVITANMVVEHLERPQRVLDEVKRVLRPGGSFIFHTPNRRSLPIRLARRVPDGPKRALIRLLEKRKDEDVFPAFYRLNSREEIDRLLRSSGFRVARLQAASSSAVTAFLGPLAVIELLYLRLLERAAWQGLRSNLLVVAVKP